MKKGSKWEKAYSIVYLIMPALFLLMYLPIWGETYFRIGGSTVGTALFSLQVLCLLLAAVNLILVLKGRVTPLFYAAAVLSSLDVVLLLVFGFIFILALSGVPLIPPQD